MKSRLVVFSLVGAFVATAAFAQQYDDIDVEALKAKAAALRDEAAAVVLGTENRGSEHEEEAQQLADSAMARLAQVKGDGTGEGGTIDFDKLLDGAGDVARGRAAGEAPLFMAFASLSMPDDSLRRLIADTSRAGGIVLFRGFPGNSARQFAAGLGKVVPKEGDFASIGIDPRLFRAFRVEAVPTFVVASSEFEPCDGFDCTTQVPPYDRMVGNVSVEYALNSFADARGPGGAVAAAALRNLRREAP